MPAVLEHANITVPDPDKTAAWMCDVFGWHIRWTGEAKFKGYTVHVGEAGSYLALYTPLKEISEKPHSYTTQAGLNHLAVTVDDLAATEARVKAQGFETHSHADYEPGERFYFHDDLGIEYEVVSYS